MAASLGDGQTVRVEHIFIDGIVAGSVVVHWHVLVPPAAVDTASSLVQSLKDSGVTIVQVNALPAPRFSASFVVDDTQGNGDGLIQRGESISLAVRITNVGEGPAESLLASVKNESGESVYIRSGRKKLGELPVGQSAVAVFELEVREGLRTQDIQLQLSLLDQERSVWLQSPIALPAFPTDFPAVSGFYQG